jgi:hypothetical protein
LSPRAEAPVPAALPRFTTRFGMGRGGSMALRHTQTAPGQFIAYKYLEQLCKSLRRPPKETGDQASPRASVPVGSPVAGRPPPVGQRLFLPRPYPSANGEVTRLVAGFALRCFQRFALPAVATEPAGRPTTPPPAGRPARSSRTRASPTQSPKRPHRIETELSHDVLNPARVPLSWANSPTLGTDSSPRMRRADIEVPNPAVD